MSFLVSQHFLGEVGLEKGTMIYENFSSLSLSLLGFYWENCRGVLCFVAISCSGQSFLVSNVCLTNITTSCRYISDHVLKMKSVFYTCDSVERIEFNVFVPLISLNQFFSTLLWYVILLKVAWRECRKAVQRRVRWLYCAMYSQRLLGVDKKIWWVAFINCKYFKESITNMK